MDRQISFPQCLPNMGKSFGFYAAVQGVQVGRLAGGDGDHNFRCAGVADDPAPGSIDAVVGPDFPGEGAGEGGGLQDGGAIM